MFVRHEALDAYWFAQMLRERAAQVAAHAQCKSTVGRSLESALGRAVRLIVEAAEGSPERADARLARAREAIGLALSHIKDLSTKRSVRLVVMADLHARGLRLIERLQELQGQAVETWSATNRLPTVLDEVRTVAHGRTRIDVVAAVKRLPKAAVRDLPLPVVAEEAIAQPPAGPGATSSAVLADGVDAQVARAKGNGVVAKA